MMINEATDIAKRLQKDVKKLKKIMDSSLANLPEEHQQKIVPIQADMNRILRSVKDGNVDAINEIRDKYADLHR